MGLNLSDSRINEFNSCVGHELITYLDFPFGSRCLSYPQFLLKNNELTNLESASFPDVGCLPMTVQGTTVEDMREKFSDIVIMKVNNEPRRNDRYDGDFGADSSQKSRYHSVYDPTYKGTPAVQFTAFRKHRLSSMMMQVLEIQESGVDFSKASSAVVHIYDDHSIPRTKSVLVAQVESGVKKFYGPFGYDIGANDEIKLFGSDAYDFRITALNEGSFDFLIDVVDGNHETVAQFVDAEYFSEKLLDLKGTFDWIPDQYLVDVIGRVARSSKNLDLPKKKIQTLKNDISEYNDRSEQVTLTRERRNKMVSLVNNYEGWQDLSDVAKKEKIENIDAAELAKFVLSDENFGEFYNKVIDREGLKERVDQAKAEYEAEEDELKRKLEGVRAEVQKYESEAEKKKNELRAEIEEESEEKRKEAEEIEGQIKSLSDELQRLESEKAKLEEGKALIQHQIHKAVEEMSDDIIVSKKIVENELLNQIVSAVSFKTRDDAKDGEIVDIQPLAVRDDEASLSDEQVIELLRAGIEDAGRDLEFNQVANILICLTQGYVTTFAGLPGTGKTSLASILSSLLGLRNEINPRFSEISVEKGWTSYKDFIGYYNPFTSSLERSVAFEAFEMLDRESRETSEIAKVPYIFLLDEANLSSMEHYWSPFLRACDSFQKGAFSVPLGDGRALLVPEYVRFIATVNFDYTTEELSPRFLDRSWVITLDPDNDVFDDEDKVSESGSLAPAPFSYDKLKNVFGFKPGLRLNNSFRSKLKEVLDICNERHFPVSPRSQRMMKNYICVADQVMNTASAQSAYSPVDFAVAQKILPQVSGTEDRVLELLERLVSVNDLPETKKRVEHMLETGRENGYYQYFG